MDNRTTRSISEDFASLIDRQRAAALAQDELVLDVVIVGSGYGAAAAAVTFANKRVEAGGRPARIAILERGNEYLPGMFPRNFSELPGHARYNLPSGSRNRSGLFDIRPSSSASAIVANGLGGGSLINAGVMERPAQQVINDDRWPFNHAALDPFLNQAAGALGAAPYAGVAGEMPRKHKALRDLDEDRYRPASITIAQADGPTPAGVNLNACINCGDCVTGCNHNAKRSLDTDLLATASRYPNVDIYTGVTVLDLRRDNNLWILNAVYTDEQLRKRHGNAVEIKTSHVVLAAGTFGSTEILGRSRAQLQLSARLGQNASTNGDNIVVDYGTSAKINAVADERTQPSVRNVGPTITGVLDFRNTGSNLVVEEMAVPASLRWIFREIYATANTLHSLAKADCSLHWNGHPDRDQYALEDDTLDHCALYAVMGDDSMPAGAAGIELVPRDKADVDSLHDDGYLKMESASINEHPVFARERDLMAALTRSTGGRTITNPGWQLLPESLQWLVRHQHGPVLTVHPLGGCNMGVDAEHGVVDQYGRVFDGTGGVHPGLAVLDGSILPTAVGINPALTITAVAYRGAEQLAANWGFVAGGLVQANRPQRDRYQTADIVFSPTQTKITVHERMDGRVRFRRAGQWCWRDHHVEITLRFQQLPIEHLYRRKNPQRQPTLTLDPAGSYIRIFDTGDWDGLQDENLADWRLERQLDARAIFRAPLEGTLGVFERQWTWSWGRVMRAGLSYLRNRLFREWLMKFEFPPPPLGPLFPEADPPRDPGFFCKLLSGIRQATHAGEKRRLVYRIEIGDPEPGSDLRLTGRRLRGTKTFTYGLAANPWNQLMETTLRRFPGMCYVGRRMRKLSVDLTYFARRDVPLFHVSAQEDQTSAIADIAAFLAYVARLLLGVHLWSFRKPDPEPAGYGATINLTPQPHPNPGVESTQISLLVPQDGQIDGIQITPRLTRYRDPTKLDEQRAPILLIHGYSAGGTTFYHPTISESAVDVFLADGRDIWVLDMRTSPDFKQTATQRWSFEEVALTEIPMAVQLIASETGRQIDVVAHCMGAAMFSMAVLEGDSNPPAGLLAASPVRAARRALSGNLRKVAFTQVTPTPVLSPINIFRGYVTRYLLDFLPIDGYSFRPDNTDNGPDSVAASDNLLDRVLSTLPYPKSEFWYENPLPRPTLSSTAPYVFRNVNTFWTRTRHRMDILYGRDFSAPNIPRQVLERIDDQFGPMNIATVSQTIHFARFKAVTNREGRNPYLTRTNINERWHFDLLTVHGEENGLVDISTARRTADILGGGFQRNHQAQIISGAGHQDALIGTFSGETFRAIADFLRTDPAEEAEPAQEHLIAFPPWIGPILTRDAAPGANWNDGYRIRIGTRPMLDAPQGVILYRTDDYDPASGTVIPPPAVDEVSAEMHFVAGPFFPDDDWLALPLPPEVVPDANLGEVLIVLVVFDAPDGQVTNTVQALGGTSVFRPFNDGGILELPGLDPGSSMGPVIIDPPLWQKIAATAVRLFQSLVTPERGPGAAVVPATVEFEPLEAPIMRRQPEAGPDPTGRIRRLGRTTRDARPDADADPDNQEMLAEAVAEALEEPVARLRDGVVDFGTIGDELRFAFGSCQFPENLLDSPVAYQGYEDLAQRLETPRDDRINPKFVVLTGDQVYVDVLAGIYDPVNADHRYHRPYFRWLRADPVRRALRRVPSWMLPDDHEFDDNWEPIAAADAGLQNQNDRYRLHGLGAYFRYQRSELILGPHDVSQSFAWPMTNVPQTHFFLLDTRSDRDHRTVDLLPNTQIIRNFVEVTNWLAAHPAEPKFVVTPSMLLPRHLRVASTDATEEALNSDSWDGYPGSFGSLLAFIANHDIQRTVFLSGDEHTACNAQIILSRHGDNDLAKVWSLHTPGIHAPFGFANAAAAKFSQREIFRTDATVDCAVTADFPAIRNSFTYLSLDPLGNNWVLRYEYRDGTGGQYVLDTP